MAGRVDMTPDASQEAVDQLHLRYRNGAVLVDSLVSAGFSVVHVDIVLEEDVRRYTEYVASCPLRIVILTPDMRSVVERELRRSSNAYGDRIRKGGSVDDAVNEFQEWLENTPNFGIRVDSTKQSPTETVQEIIDRWDEALV